jgi:TPR repeat protein
VRWRACVVLALALAPTAAAAQHPNPILEPDQLWAFNGFALKPPGGRGWFSLSRTRAGATIARLTGSTTHTLIAVASAERLGEPVASPEALAGLVDARRAKVPQDPRFRVLASNARRDDRDGAWCITYRLAADDARMPDTPLVVRIAGRACAHPAAHDLLVDVTVSERGRREELGGETADAIQKFLDGIRLAPPAASAALVEADRLLDRGAETDAVRALERLVERGEPLAALRLARLYDSGRGVPADPARAERLYRIAAEAGEVDALYNLGVFHERARTGARDAAEAVRWFRRAADQRDAQAQLNLGLLYFKGDGVPRDHTRAREWLSLAAENGSERARELARTLVFEPSPWDGLPVRPSVVLDPP